MPNVYQSHYLSFRLPSGRREDDIKKMNFCSQIISLASTQLTEISDSPALDTQILLEYVTGLNQIKLETTSHMLVTPKQTEQFQELIKKRSQGIPVAYLTGKKEFFGLEFEVNPNVLIPRPETERLTELALDRIQTYLPRRQTGKLPVSTQASSRGGPPTSYKLLDMGTGSGCVAVSLFLTLSALGEGGRRTGEAGDNASGKVMPPASPLPLSQMGEGKIEITATDLSPKALVVAKRNAHRHRANIKFIQSDLFEGLANQKFDLIVANLPYVRETDYQNNLFELQAEPKIALTDGTNNWQLITKFIQQLPDYINQNGSILMEIDPGACSAIEKTVKENLPNAEIKLHRDYSSRWRYVEIII